MHVRIKLCSFCLTNEKYEAYEAESGQLINKGKSCFIVGKKMEIARCNILAECTGFQKRTFPVKYLGLYSL